MTASGSLVPGARGALGRRFVHRARRVLSDLAGTDRRPRVVTGDFSHALAVACRRFVPDRPPRGEVVHDVQTGSWSVRRTSLTGITVVPGTTPRPETPGLPHEALLVRGRRFGAWLATDDGCHAATIDSPCLRKPWAHVCCRVSASKEGPPPELVDAVRRGTRAPVVCGCMDLVAETQFTGVASDVPAPRELDGFRDILRGSRGERMAWLHAPGLPSNHIVFQRRTFP